MATITLYGPVYSRACRCLWALEESGLAYRHVPLGLKGEAQEPDFLAINPNGRVPALTDGGVALFESLAINSYVAKKAGGALAPKDLVEDAFALQWSFWAANELERPLLRAVHHALGILDYPKDPAIVADCMAQLDRPLTVLDAALTDRDWLAADRFMLADLNVASVLYWARTGRLDLSAYGHVDHWLKACLARPAFRRVVGMLKAR